MTLFFYVDFFFFCSGIFADENYFKAEANGGELNQRIANWYLVFVELIPQRSFSTA